MDRSEEKELVRRWKRNPEAFGRAYDAYFDPVFRYILLRTANVANAEDLVGQTFYKALKSCWKFRWSGAPILSWLLRIANNEVNAFLRRKKPILGNVESLAEQLTDGGYQPDEELVAAENEVAKRKRFLQLHQCIRELKPQDQALIVFRYFENKPFSEISLILGKREGALRMGAMRALEKLRFQLEVRGISDEEFGTETQELRNASGGGGYFQAKATS